MTHVRVSIFWVYVNGLYGWPLKTYTFDPVFWALSFKFVYYVCLWHVNNNKMEKKKVVVNIATNIFLIICGN